MSQKNYNNDLGKKSTRTNLLISFKFHCKNVNSLDKIKPTT